MKFSKYSFAALVVFLSIWGLNAQSTVLSREDYVARYAPIAVEQQALYGIPASITLAQGILESGCGNSRLATSANNHFGIKCGKDWLGSSLNHDDDAPQECFRSYPSVDESYIDHSLFLREKQRYSALFDLNICDYKGWARGLKAAGYATNPAYADMLIKIIEDNELYRYDTMPLAENKTKDERRETKDEGRKTKGEREETKGSVVERIIRTVDVDRLSVSLNAASGYGVYSDGGARYVVARADDSLENIASATGVPVGRLRRYNGLAKGATVIEGERIFLETRQRS